MPEGHTIHRAARRLRSVLLDRPLEHVQARGADLKVAQADRRLRGATATGVEARGKHLLIHFDNGLSLHSHLRMDGAWHLYRSGERWKRPGRTAWLVLEAGGWQAVNFDGPVLELHVTGSLLRDQRLLALGPDVLVDPFDDAEYLRRMRATPNREIGDAVLQQRIVAGIGNIYKAESLFLCGLDPWRRVRAFDDGDLRALRETATAIMREGVLDERAITFRGPGPPGKWVYGRGGEACRRCSTPIDSALQGADQRITWWCPRCQS